MTDTPALSERLSAILEKVGGWRKDAAVIKTLAEQAALTRVVSEPQLLRVEEISTAVYQEIAAFDALVAEQTEANDLDRAMITEAGDALRLVLLEITELSTAMYAADSAWALDDGRPPPPAEGDVWS